MMINVCVIVTTLNEENRISSCLEELKDFNEIIVLDSYSKDGTCQISKELGARVENFQWNRQYPKKRQWALDNLDIKNVLYSLLML